MELLPEGQQNSTQVTWQDQQQINEFSTLMTHFDRLNDKLKILQQDKEQIDDVSLELELVDEDELVDYLIGGLSDVSNADNGNGIIIGDGCFVKMKQSQVMAKLEEQGEKLDSQIEDTNSQIESLSGKLSGLKSSLYAKFGDAINLER
jgi:prefoldin subunit 4